jgi:hypothetical protein
MSRCCDRPRLPHSFKSEPAADRRCRLLRSDGWTAPRPSQALHASLLVLPIWALYSFCTPGRAFQKLVVHTEALRRCSCRLGAGRRYGRGGLVTAFRDPYHVVLSLFRCGVEARFGWAPSEVDRVWSFRPQSLTVSSGRVPAGKPAGPGQRGDGLSRRATRFPFAATWRPTVPRGDSL